MRHAGAAALRTSIVRSGLLGLGGVLSLAGLSACGGQGSQVAITITPADAGQAALGAGETAAFTVTLVNQGVSSVTGASLRVDLPADFRYKSTRSISEDGAARTLPVDAAVNSSKPVWGLWSLQGPGHRPDGSVRRAQVSITFETSAAGPPGDYPLVPSTSSDSSDGQTGPPLTVHLDPTTRLTATITALQGSVAPGGTVDYRVTLTNEGSGGATQVALLVTLPPTIAFQSTQRISGNSGRSGAINPSAGALLPYYGGFTVPARSAAGPGLLSIIFRARCVPAATGGRYTLSAQITDQAGQVVVVNDTAPVTINGPAPTVPPTPVPTPPPGPKPTPTPPH
ncbi:MAG: hypothetical protein ABR541_09235 [Candidatus Dormibacteria bacterium]